MLKPYENYKMCDVPGINLIPKNWEVSKNIVIFKERNTKSIEENGNLLSVSQYSGVRTRDVSKKIGMHKADNLLGYKHVLANDLVMNIMLAWNSSVGVSRFNGVTSPSYAVFEINSKFNPWYFHYLLRIPEMSKYFETFSTGLIKSRLRLYPNTFNKMLSIIPSRSEQNQIVQYLDWKCADIHKIIKAKKKEIKLLQEQVNSIYNDLLFGSDSNVEKKDSNVVWMGAIPRHWDICTMKQLFSIKKDIAGMEGIDVISVTQSGLKIKNIENNEGQMAKSYANYQRVKYNDFVMNHMDLLTGWIDCAKIEGVTSPDYRVFVANNEESIDREYFLALFKLFYKRKIFFGYGQGIATSGRWRLPKTNFLNMPVPLPPKKEQEKIHMEIKGKTDKLFLMLAKIEDEIKLLNEYRVRLISDVVTGKVDVRNIVLPSFEPEVDETDEEFDDESDNVEELEDEVDADE